MKKAFLFALCLVIVCLNLGCQSNKTRVGEGAVIGGLLGATAGGIIGHQSRHGGQGAAIGAAAGAITGAIIGTQIEKPGQAAQAPAATAANPNQMSIAQIVEMSQQRINEAVIIDKIQLTNSRFNLSAEDINYLRQQGVSEKVIAVMQSR